MQHIKSTINPIHPLSSTSPPKKNGKQKHTLSPPYPPKKCPQTTKEQQTNTHTNRKQLLKTHQRLLLKVGKFSLPPKVRGTQAWTWKRYSSPAGEKWHGINARQFIVGKSTEPRKKHLITFHWIHGWLIGILKNGLIIISKINWVVCHPAYQSTNLGEMNTAQLGEFSPDFWTINSNYQPSEWMNAISKERPSRNKCRQKSPKDSRLW